MPPPDEPNILGGPRSTTGFGGFGGTTTTPTFSGIGMGGLWDERPAEKYERRLRSISEGFKKISTEAERSFDRIKQRAERLLPLLDRIARATGGRVGGTGGGGGGISGAAFSGTGGGGGPIGVGTPMPITAQQQTGFTGLSVARFTASAQGLIPGGVPGMITQAGMNLGARVATSGPGIGSTIGGGAITAAAFTLGAGAQMGANAMGANADAWITQDIFANRLAMMSGYSPAAQRQWLNRLSGDPGVGLMTGAASHADFLLGLQTLQASGAARLPGSAAFESQIRGTGMISQLNPFLGYQGAAQITGQLMSPQVLNRMMGQYPGVAIPRGGVRNPLQTIELMLQQNFGPRGPASMAQATAALRPGQGAYEQMNQLLGGSLADPQFHAVVTQVAGLMAQNRGRPIQWDDPAAMRRLGLGEQMGRRQQEEAAAIAGQSTAKFQATYEEFGQSMERTADAVDEFTKVVERIPEPLRNAVAELAGGLHTLRKTIDIVTGDITGGGGGGGGGGFLSSALGVAAGQFAAKRLGRSGLRALGRFGLRALPGASAAFSGWDAWRSGEASPLNIGGAALGGAVTGATFGSAFGPIGTGVGGLLGLLLGGGGSYAASRLSPNRDGDAGFWDRMGDSQEKLWGGVPDAPGNRGTPTALAIHKLLAGVPHRISSMVRPGARTRSGGYSYHATGHAIDITGPSRRRATPTRDDPELLAIYQALLPYKRSGALQELIYGGPGGGGWRSTETRDGHLNHVHAAATASGISKAGVPTSPAATDGSIGAAGAALAGAGLAWSAPESIGGLGFSLSSILSAVSMFSGGMRGGAPSMTPGSRGSRTRTREEEEKENLRMGASAPVRVGGGNAAANKALGRQMAAARGWSGDEWAALELLWQRESGWSHTADNPRSSAYGIPQALIAMHAVPKGYFDRKEGSGASIQAYGGDPRVQIQWGLDYIQGRYKSPSKAMEHWRQKKWYDGSGTGGMFMAEGDGEGQAGVPAPVSVPLSVPAPAPLSGARGGGGGPIQVVNPQLHITVQYASQDEAERLGRMIMGWLHEQSAAESIGGA